MSKHKTITNGRLSLFLLFSILFLSHDIDCFNDTWFVQCLCAFYYFYVPLKKCKSSIDFDQLRSTTTNFDQFRQTTINFDRLRSITIDYNQLRSTTIGFNHPIDQDWYWYLRDQLTTSNYKDPSCWLLCIHHALTGGHYQLIEGRP